MAFSSLRLQAHLGNTAKFIASNATPLAMVITTCGAVYLMMRPPESLQRLQFYGPAGIRYIPRYYFYSAQYYYANDDGLNIEPRELALLCQKVENHVVGAPCGVMDQMTSACGESNKLLAMICQPAEVLGLVDIPSHIRFWGIDSGIRHSVGGADYGSVRIGAFMGRKIIKFVASELLSQSSANGVTSDDLDEDGIELLETGFPGLLTETEPPPGHDPAIVRLSMLSNFLKQWWVRLSWGKYSDHNDPVTVIDSKRNYGLRAATRHPIYENFRVKAFKALLTSAASDDQLTALGELLYQCHYSYSTCGLGSDGTDRVVQLVQEMQHSKKSSEGTLYGAKIIGGGSGGTVCIIGKNCLRSNDQIIQIQ